MAVLLFNTFLMNAQKNSEMKNNTELESQSKIKLIQVAIDILKVKQPFLVITPDEYESTAWGSSKEIIVKFRRYIRFIPLGAEPFQHYDITVNLITKQILPFDSGYSFTFYTPTEEYKKKINFIKEKANFSIQSESEITITENEEHYWISNKSKTSFSKFFINKKTGFKSGTIEGTYSVPQIKPVLESIYEKEEIVEFFDESEIGQITKGSTIHIAKDILKQKHPKLSINFDDYIITVLGNSKNTLVKFRRIIRYIPLSINPEKNFSYDITVNLNTNEILPFDDFPTSEFYIETKEDKKAIEFIQKNFGPLSTSFENTILEGEEDYYIDCQNKYSYGIYILNKKTGKEGPAIQTSYEPMTEPNVNKNPNNFIEIK